MIALMEVLICRLMLTRISLKNLRLTWSHRVNSRKNNRIGQKPIIVGHSNDTDTSHQYSIKNKGNGPANFRKVEYFSHLKPLTDKSLSEAIDEAFAIFGIRLNEKSITQLGQKGVLASGEEIVLLKLVVHPDDVSKTTNLDKKVKFDMRITYESVHGKSDVWASDDRLLNK